MRMCGEKKFYSKQFKFLKNNVQGLNRCSESQQREFTMEIGNRDYIEIVPKKKKKKIFGALEFP